MPTVQVNGTSIYYEREGGGPPLLMIHGLGSSGDDWAFQREDFARHFTLILPDLRGAGRSAKPPGPYSIGQFAADLWALLDALGVESTNILGFSLGGAVAQEMALAQPVRVRRLVLCNALANYRTDTPRKWLEARLQVAMVHVLGLRRTAGLIANRLFPHEDQAPKRQRVIDVVGANPKTAYLATIHALIGWSALDRIHTIACPVLILAAEFDYTALQEKRAEAAHFQYMQFVVMNGSRHGTPFDAIEEFNRRVLEFLMDDASVRVPAHQPISAPL
ncbi:MAG: alpha/beta fold hydrolase [Xanthomonadaceae bacterium]|nr:alpha/beta fold hydrolase [Xanthomonadaceae bacterium]MDE1960021.1 alpha/beta fold hydrolase [Xanthomonadaceae bacterium]MDE2083914.1 alpha/beta fold hydrolase [Xanthomonadaceae bacterium]MDE2256617.1 alpha/beta fold hydrolase [Xanthomonadaceae bacterium]